MKRIVVRGVASFAVAAWALIASAATPAAAGEVALTIVNVATPQDVKIWIPESIVAKKGDTVKLKLINKLPADHGYKIAAVNLEKVVKPDETVDVTFTADKAGIFPITCQLHPAHVVGQLVVLE